ncbi:MAG TPA: proline--tRNA ligase [Patescibacteria group bacterium]|nr:proline--tRNA ligase [Patescibacteria group bacterium]
MNDKKIKKKNLVKKSQNISKWYNEVVSRAKLVDQSEVKGAMIMRANSFEIWEQIKKVLDGWFKDYGVRNYYFPMLIPHYLLEKEKEHLKGFSPELAVVTHAGGKDLKEPYVLRPTSETIIYKTFADWIESYRDLPFLINQWCNIVRWEKRTYPFLRTSEFLWQEGHTAHKTKEQAKNMTLRALKWYEKIYKDYLAISSYVGIKSEQEKFAGAKKTYSIEIVVPNGKALQAATSHNLGDNFSKVFNINFLDKKGKKNHPFQTSWGLSTRSIGGLILVHGDDAGLIIPPKIAPNQVVIITVPCKDKKDQERVEKYSKEIMAELEKNNFRVILDSDNNHGFGFKINNWELKGIPLRLEIGANEVKNKKLTLARRDNFKKQEVERDQLINEVTSKLEMIQNNLLKKSQDIRNNMTIEVDDYEEFKKIAQGSKKFIRAFWCGNKKCENNIKHETKFSTRVLEIDQLDKKEKGKCIYCGRKADHKWLFAQSY